MRLELANDVLEQRPDLHDAESRHPVPRLDAGEQQQRRRKPAETAALALDVAEEEVAIRRLLLRSAL